MSELKPCPFCGCIDLEKEVVRECGYDVITIICEMCGAMCYQEQWNNRPESELDALKGAVRSAVQQCNDKDEDYAALERMYIQHRDECERLREALHEASRLLTKHEVWDRECPMNKEAEFNALHIEPLLQAYGGKQ